MLQHFLLRRDAHQGIRDADLDAAIAADADVIAGLDADDSLRAKDDETKTWREFTLEGIGQTSRGYAPNQRQQDPCCVA